MEDLRYKIESLSRQLTDISKDKFDSCISPSNKKYLQVVTHNSSLLYDNLCLTQKVDRLQHKLKRHKLKHTRSDPTPAIITNTEQSPITQENQHEIIKIFERKKTTGTPLVTFLKDEDVKLKKKHRSVTKLKLSSPNDSKLTVFQVSELQSPTSSTSCKVTRKRSRSAPKIIQTSNME